MKQLISNGHFKAFKFYGVSRFIADLFAINDGNAFRLSFKYIYSKEVDLKIQHQGDHTPFLDLDIKIENHVFLYKLFGNSSNALFF